MDGGYLIAPNSMFERLLRCGLERAELLCLMYIWRETAGRNRDQAPIPVRELAKGTKQSERSAYTGLAGLRDKKLIPSTCKETRGKPSMLWIDMARFDTLPEAPDPPPEGVSLTWSGGKSVERALRTKAKVLEMPVEIVEPEFATGWCFGCGKIGPVALIENDVADVDSEDPSEDQSFESGTSTGRCRGDEKAKTFPTPARSFRGVEAEVEHELVAWVSVFRTVPPAGLVEEVAETLGGASMDDLRERILLRRQWLASYGFRGFVMLARDANDAFRYLQKWQRPKAQGGGGRDVELLVNDLAKNADDAAFWLERGDTDAEFRAALLKRFPELPGGGA